MPLNFNNLNVNKRRLYNQFFTPELINTTVVEQSIQRTPIKICDLAMGEGALLAAAHHKWKNVKLIGNDIDHECILKAKDLIPEIKHYNLDFSDLSNIPKLIKKIGLVDLCLGNPPFGIINNNKFLEELFHEFGLSKLAKTPKVNLEILYLLIAIKITRPSGEIITIVPDGIIVNERYSEFRQFLISNFEIKVMELPPKIFAKTEAKTHILTIRKGHNSKSIELSNSDGGKLKLPIRIATHRMDYTYHLANRSFIASNNKPFEILRGNLPNKTNNVKKILHTTDFKSDFQEFMGTVQDLIDPKFKVAQAGDIVIPRVGTRCLGKVAIIKKGKYTISDCLIIIRAPKSSTRKQILNYLTSEEGKNSIKSISRGVAARHITIKDISSILLAKLNDR